MRTIVIAFAAALALMAASAWAQESLDRLQGAVACGFGEIEPALDVHVDMLGVLDVKRLGDGERRRATMTVTQ